jgi:hypothetical protein
LRRPFGFGEIHIRKTEAGNALVISDLEIESRLFNDLLKQSQGLGVLSHGRRDIFPGIGSVIIPDIRLLPLNHCPARRNHSHSINGICCQQTFIRMNQCHRLAKSVSAVLLRRHGWRNYLCQLHRFSSGFEFGNVSFRCGAQFIMMDDREKNRRAEDNAGGKEDFPTAVHVVDGIEAWRCCPALIIGLLFFVMVTGGYFKIPTNGATVKINVEFTSAITEQAEICNSEKNKDANVVNHGCLMMILPGPYFALSWLNKCL